MARSPSLLRAVFDAEQLGHFLVLKTPSRDIGLYPFAVQNKLRDGPLAGSADHFFGRAGDFFNVDFLVRNLVLRQPTLGGVAIAAPGSCVDSQVWFFQCSFWMITDCRKMLICKGTAGQLCKEKTRPPTRGRPSPKYLLGFFGFLLFD